MNAALSNTYSSKGYENHWKTWNAWNLTIKILWRRKLTTSMFEKWYSYISLYLS